MGKQKKKLIEVALPLEAINKASAREKSIRHGHPSTLHLWWARRPLAACRAVLFAQLVDDPSSHPDEFPTEAAQEKERKRLFGIIERLVEWENVNNEQVLEEARAEIRKSTGGNPPPVLDPFAGGGSIPLEAQRLGLEAHASDLNPVAVLINKALIEIPPKFADHPPVNPEQNQEIIKGGWKGAQGLAEDVRYYGKWMRNEAEKRIGHLYPKVKLPEAHGGGEATVIAWIWARTVASPNPACNGAHVPLVRSFWLSKRKGKEAWIEPVVDRANNTYRFEVRTGNPGAEQKKVIDAGTGFVNRSGKKVKATFQCVLSGDIIKGEYIDREANDGRMSMRLMAVVAEGKNGQIYLSPNDQIEQELNERLLEWTEAPEFNSKLPNQQCRGTFASNAQGRRYGFFMFKDYFTTRQLVALSTFSDLISKAREQIYHDAMTAGLTNDTVSLNDGGTGAAAYSDAVATYLAFAINRSANYWSSLTPWGGGFIVQTFGRQALPMVWDFAEGNPFSEATGNWMGAIDWIIKSMKLSIPLSGEGRATQHDASNLNGDVSERVVICTDPPYYDNIVYSDLSDFFYVWSRRSLKDIYPDLFRTMITPKNEELIASPYRHGGSKEKARLFFEAGLLKTFTNIRNYSDPEYPLTIYYAFKQLETDRREHEQSFVASTGWESMLEGLIQSGFVITGTLPLRTERDQGLKTGTNVLASSIVLVCRPRPADAPPTTRREFLRALKRELPDALRDLQQGNIAPVDLAQAAIGPGMAVYSRHGKVIEADGSTMRVRTALALINQTLDEFLTEQEGEFDTDTRWALSWFEQYGMEKGPYGEAETLSTARNTSVNGLVEAGILEAKGGKVRLLQRGELLENWDPQADTRTTVWETTQYLIRALDTEGETGAARLLQKVNIEAEMARDLAYRLFTVCERKGWAQEALAYNGLVIAWPEIVRLASENTTTVGTQIPLTFADNE